MRIKLTKNCSGSFLMSSRKLLEKIELNIAIASFFLFPICSHFCFSFWRAKSFLNNILIKAEPTLTPKNWLREKLTLFSKGRNRMRPTVHILGYVIKHLDFSLRVCTVNPKGFPNRSVKNAALSCNRFRSSFANSQHPNFYQYHILKILKIFERKNNNTISLLEICFLVLRLHFLPIDIGSPAPEKQSEG